MVYICNNYMCKLESNESENRSIHENLTEDDDDNNVSDILNDTCLQPTDIGQKVLDHYFYDIYEANEGNEAKSFPPLLSQIRKTPGQKKRSEYNMSKYFNNRLTHGGKWFAQDTDCIF